MRSKVTALLVGWPAHVVVLTLLYMIISSLYTVWMKRLVVVDIFVPGHALRITRVLLGEEASRIRHHSVDAGVLRLLLRTWRW
ncbi:MAG: hypothetical protein IPL62_15010 [Caulobacteraceae bacterium]|nr:hypothetical protein [Caulobacteraceae bacterium]